jgi:hypothetical protein
VRAHSGRREVGGCGGAMLAHPHASSPEAVESSGSAGGGINGRQAVVCVSVSRATWTTSTCERSGLEGVACSILEWRGLSSQLALH